MYLYFGSFANMKKLNSYQKYLDNFDKSLSVGNPRKVEIDNAQREMNDIRRQYVGWIDDSKVKAAYERIAQAKNKLEAVVANPNETASQQAAKGDTAGKPAQQEAPPEASKASQSKAKLPSGVKSRLGEISGNLASTAEKACQRIHGANGILARR